MIRVVVGEDSYIAREGISRALEGWSNPAISERLAITTRAAERHISSIFSKLGLGDTEQISRRVKAAVMYLADQVG
jgi:DNA-binding NarL/FixJ family response regulator